MLMSIIAATVLGRGINTEQIDLATQMDKIRNHFRYAQSMAMKNGDQVWGFRCAGGPPHEYWIFRGNDPDVAGNQVQLPGENNVKVSLTTAGVTMEPFDIFFDKYGIPYSTYTDENTNTPLADFSDDYSEIDISAGSYNRKFRISPETGLIQ
jgi:hypothetical protein